VIGADEAHTSVSAGATSESSDVAHCEELLRTLLSDERAEHLERWLAPDVVVWTPVRYTSTRADLLSDLDVDVDADTLTEVVITVTHADVMSPRVHLEWRLTARFSHPCFVDDDLLVEPTGRLVETAGVMITTIDDGMITAARCYYDDFALLEQLVSSV
jgi:ketosteroid isomerase-like protein